MKHSTLLAVIYISIIFLCNSCSPAFRETNSEPITAILGALEKEITLLEGQLTAQRQQRIEGIRFVNGNLNGRSVVIAWTGVGKVNAAMTTTLLLEHFRPSEVIFTGIAGGVNPQLQAGDIVIARKTAQHDLGVMWPDGFINKGVKNPLDGWENPVFFPADERLLKLARAAAEQVELQTIETNTGPRTPRIVTGIIVSGDVFVASPDKCIELRNKLEADAVEMEGAAVAQICYQRQIGYIVIRSISDMADEGAVLDKQIFYMLAAKNSAGLVAEIVRLLGSELPAVPK